MKSASRLLFLLSIGIAGCTGPLTFPAVKRLPPDQQTMVDGEWHNMLTPPDRLDKELLLDAIIVNQLHQSGVNRVRFTSEKDYDGGLVRMTVVFDSARPQLDVFDVQILDNKRHVVRSESYPGDHVMSRIKSLTENPFDAVNADTTPATVPSIEAAAYNQALQERMDEIRAATQPSR